MTHFARTSRFAVLLSLLLASQARADWLDSFTYNVAVSSSATGPFTSSANLWAGSSPTSIDLVASPDPHATEFNGNSQLPFASLFFTYSTDQSAPPAISHLPYFIQLTLPSGANVVLSGDVSSPNFSTTPITFTDGSPVGSSPFAITVQAMQLPAPQSFTPGQTTFGFGYELFANIPASELAPASAPEPSALVLAGMGGASLLGAAWRRRYTNHERNSSIDVAAQLEFTIVNLVWYDDKVKIDARAGGGSDGFFSNRRFRFRLA